MRPLNTWFIVLLTLLLAGGISLLWVEVDVSVRSTGIIRPVEERTEIRPVVSGVVEAVHVQEGQTITAGAPILSLRNSNLAPRQMVTGFEMTQRQLYIRDLERMTRPGQPDSNLPSQLQTAAYKQQFAQYQYKHLEYQTACRRAADDLRIADQLLKGKVIAGKEHFEKAAEYDRARAALQAFESQQQAVWEQELQRYRQELRQYQADRQRMEAEDSLYTLRAPVTGTVQGISNRYAGGMLQAGETICTISPQAALQAECYVNTRDAGLLQTGQPVQFQIDAFDYNYFGVLSGRVISIDNDFSLVNNQPVFKVRCAFSSTHLQLRNGFTARLKKGLTYQARFLVARRKLWQLLWDTVDDWMNPAAPLTAQLNPPH
jgi:HlyD family secretion protein